MNITTTIHISQKAKEYIITRFKPLDFETMTSNFITHWTWPVTLELEVDHQYRVTKSLFPYTQIERLKSSFSLNFNVLLEL